MCARLRWSTAVSSIMEITLVKSTFLPFSGIDILRLSQTRGQGRLRVLQLFNLLNLLSAALGGILHESLVISLRVVLFHLGLLRLLRDILCWPWQLFHEYLETLVV